MPLDTSLAAAVISALRVAGEHGGARAALHAAGIDPPWPERLDGLGDDPARAAGAIAATVGGLRSDYCAADGDATAEALALGMLAGTATQQRRVRIAGDATSFLMDPELVVQHAAGESILRLPWFEKGLFVGRQLPDITEMPAPIRLRCVEHYSAALAGTRGQFTIHSYGHAYTVDAVPVRAADGTIEAVLAVASPMASHISAAKAYERTAANSEDSAARADRRAELHGLAGRDAAELAARRVADRARQTAERARENARRLRARTHPDGYVEAPTVTPRELEVLELASHGLTAAEIAEQLALSIGTVKTHLQNVYPKLGVNDKAAAVATALRHGLFN
jgi:DNA-binding NarL/FixJ family response regulator